MSLALFRRAAIHSRNPRAYLKILVFRSDKALSPQTLLVLGQKKRRLFDSWCRHGAKIKKAPFRRLFSIFRKIVFFSKIKGAFYFNCAPALDQTAKGAFFSKSMDFQLSLEKIKSISFLVNFFEKFKIAHKIHFSSWFFKNLKIWQNTIFSACFLYIIVRKKRASEKVRFYCRRLKIYFQKATNVINAFPTSITSYEASFSKRRLFHLKIAWFSWKVSEFWWFFENQKAPFF